LGNSLFACNDLRIVPRFSKFGIVGGSALLTRSTLKRHSDAYFGLTIQEIGERLETAADTFAFEIGIWLGQGPNEPIPLVAERCVR
jgi:hypothetical protein